MHSSVCQVSMRVYHDLAMAGWSSVFIEPIEFFRFNFFLVIGTDEKKNGVKNLCF